VVQWTRAKRIRAIMVRLLGIIDSAALETHRA
jgi:hypothetical protein